MNGSTQAVAVRYSAAQKNRYRKRARSFYLGFQCAIGPPGFLAAPKTGTVSDDEKSNIAQRGDVTSQADSRVSALLTQSLATNASLLDEYFAELRSRTAWLTAWLTQEDTDNDGDDDDILSSCKGDGADSSSSGIQEASWVNGEVAENVDKNDNTNDKYVAELLDSLDKNYYTFSLDACSTYPREDHSPLNMQADSRLFRRAYVPLVSDKADKKEGAWDIENMDENMEVSNPDGETDHSTPLKSFDVLCGKTRHAFPSMRKLDMPPLCGKTRHAFPNVVAALLQAGRVEELWSDADTNTHIDEILEQRRQRTPNEHQKMDEEVIDLTGDEEVIDLTKDEVSQNKNLVSTVFYSWARTVLLKLYGSVGMSYGSSGSYGPRLKTPWIKEPVHREHSTHQDDKSPVHSERPFHAHQKDRNQVHSEFTSGAHRGKLQSSSGSSGSRLKWIKKPMHSEYPIHQDDKSPVHSEHPLHAVHSERPTHQNDRNQVHSEFTSGAHRGKLQSSSGSSGSRIDRIVRKRKQTTPIGWAPSMARFSV